jgi:ABC-type bacteriocin/lantibiotic exporter with double-glycine peptidase domain
MKRTTILLALLALIAVPVFAAPAPSKAVANQSIDSRAADIAMVRDFVANEQVAQALAARGFSQEQINQRVAQLSNQDLHQLAQNLNQLQAGGYITNREWIYILIGAVAILIIAVAA